MSVAEHIEKLLRKEIPVIKDGQGRILLNQNGHPPGIGQIAEVGGGKYYLVLLALEFVGLSDKPVDALSNKGS